MGAWIETFGAGLLGGVFNVAPYVGAWIETFGAGILGGVFNVAPYVGAWIETDTNKMPTSVQSRTLRGCVD